MTLFGGFSLRSAVIASETHDRHHGHDDRTCELSAHLPEPSRTSLAWNRSS